jgi:hypothetical protein
MVPLVPIVFPATAPVAVTNIPPWAQPFKLVKLKKENRVAQVTKIDTTNPALPPMVEYEIINPRNYETDPFHAPTRGRTGAAEKVSAGHINLMWEPKEAKKARPYYMEPTPSKDKSIGQQVEARMRAEGKIVGTQVRYERDARGNPTPGKVTWYPLSGCVMGHIIDAVTWWNSNGRFTGPQSKEVQKFMTDPDNYEIEPAGPNSLRGAMLDQEYMTSAK